jgi:predicted nucleic acid-binding protein
VIILDTNVISEVMAPAPLAVVQQWMDATPAFELATTTINVAEIRYGLARLPMGRRRGRMEMLFNGLLVSAFEDRVFPFDQQSADTFAELAAARERRARPFRGVDGLIAAIALSRGAGVATRDVRGFEGCGIEVINPWDAAAT